MKRRTRQSLKRRFLNFETFNGAFVFIPWGAGFIYCGLFDLRLGYSYALVSAGAVLTVWGLRKACVDRVKQQARIEKMVEEYHACQAPATAGDA
jgi:hypothetical protein